MIAHHGTLASNIVSQVVLSTIGRYWITFVNRTLSGEIYVTLDGTTPIIKGDDTHVVILGRTFRMTDTTVVIGPSGDVTIKMVSNVPLEYSVEVVS